MLFNSYEFLLGFLPVTLVGYFAAAQLGPRAGAIWLSVASLFFYGWWAPRYLLLLLMSITANYACGLQLAQMPDRRAAQKLLAAAIVANLLLLGYYKYCNFFISTLNQAGFKVQALDILLPIGISFFTFTQIAFLADVYSGRAKEFDFVRYVLFVTFFPHLIAGPVLHHKEMMPQFAVPETSRFQIDNFSIGMTIFTIGLAKKVLLADGFANWASPIFASADSGFKPGLVVAWLGALAYTLQLYFDFSGYSDMAIGLSRLFGIKLPVNFNSPYKALNIVDFWRRWHMTLSRFLRDYLYIPLGGNRHGPWRRHGNLMVTMILGGLWHGASWTFVLWGTLHGIYLVIYHAWSTIPWRCRAKSYGAAAAAKAAAWTLTFCAVVVAWVVFRASNPSSAVAILKGMAGFNGVILPETVVSVVPGLAKALLALGAELKSADVLALGGSHFLGEPRELVVLTILAILILPMPNTQELMARYTPVLESGPLSSGWYGLNAGTGVLCGILFWLCLMSLDRRTEFLYFQF